MPGREVNVVEGGPFRPHRRMACSRRLFGTVALNMASLACGDISALLWRRVGGVAAAWRRRQRR